MEPLSLVNSLDVIGTAMTQLLKLVVETAEEESICSIRTILLFAAVYRDDINRVILVNQDVHCSINRPTIRRVCICLCNFYYSTTIDLE